MMCVGRVRGKKSAQANVMVTVTLIRKRNLGYVFLKHCFCAIFLNFDKHMIPNLLGDAKYCFICCIPGAYPV